MDPDNTGGLRSPFLNPWWTRGQGAAWVYLHSAAPMEALKALIEEFPDIGATGLDLALARAKLSNPSETLEFADGRGALAAFDEAIASGRISQRRIDEQHEGRYSRASILKQWPGSHPKPRSASKRGRPVGTAKYNWPAFNIKVVAILEDRGSIDRRLEPSWNLAALELEMTKWCKETWGSSATPSESMIRAHCKAAYAAFLQNHDKSKAD